MSRVIAGLIWARASAKPGFVRKASPRGRKAAGLKYERELAKALPLASHGQWFEFQDRAGRGWCQPDVFFELHGQIFVLEAKYTWVSGAERQISQLYRPVLEAVYGLPVRGVVVCKVLTPEVASGWICRTLAGAMEQAEGGETAVLHWIGAGLEPFRAAPHATHLATGLALL